MSIPGTEWVNAATEIPLIPLSANILTVSNETFPQKSDVKAFIRFADLSRALFNFI